MLNYFGSDADVDKVDYAVTQSLGKLGEALKRYEEGGEQGIKDICYDILLNIKCNKTKVFKAYYHINFLVREENILCLSLISGFFTNFNSLDTLLISVCLDLLIFKIWIMLSAYLMEL